MFENIRAIQTFKAHTGMDRKHSTSIHTFENIRRFKIHICISVCYKIVCLIIPNKTGYKF